MRAWLAIFMLGVAAPTVAAPATPPVAQKFETEVLRVHSTKAEVDKSAPWQFEEVNQQSFLGIVLPGGKILTTAFAVADATYLELQRFGSSHRDEAVVEFVDYEVNLALLHPADPEALKGLNPVQLGEDLATEEQVDIYKVRDAYQLSRLSASLQEVGLFGAVTSSYTVVSYLFKVQQTGLGWAEPVFRQGKLVALTTGQDQNFVHALPVSMLRHFLDDSHDAHYRGFPSIGVQLASLVSPDQRQQIGAGGRDDGVRIAEVQKGSAFAQLLKVDDVILSVDGHPISEHGFYTHQKWGKVHLKYLINQHYAGDRLKVSVLRAGKVQEIAGTLERFDSNRAPVVAYRYGQPEPHLIVGGLVFMELSQDYLKQWGKDWRDVAPYDLLYTLEYANKPADDPATRVIFVARVLADEFNRGYGEVRHAVVDTVNGQKVQSLAALRAALAAPVVERGRNYARIKFDRDGGEAILAYDGLKAAHARIAATYEVKTPESFFTP